MLTSSNANKLLKAVGVEQAFRMFAEAGLDAMDYPVDNGFATPDLLTRANVYGLDESQIKAKYGKIKEIADRNNIIIRQTHAAFGRFAVSSAPVFPQLIQNAIIATSVLGAKYTVVHPVKIPGRLFKEKRDEGFSYNLAFYSQFIPYCEKYGVKIAIENLWERDGNGVIHECECSDAHDVVRYINELGSDNFCACADLGHFALTEKDTKISVADSIRILGKHLQVIHLHEVNMITDTHFIPYSFENIMDWESIIQAFKDVKFTGIMNLEVIRYLSNFPLDLYGEAMRRISVMAHYLANRIEN